jgi:hypothetical protein
LGDADASVDSELRFYAGWYVVAGSLMRRAALDPELDRSVRPTIEAGWILAVAGRLLSVRAAGRPHPIFLALTALEVAMAAVLVSVPPTVE